MKVKELIEKLSKMPQEATLTIRHQGYYAQNDWEEVDDPILVRGRIDLVQIAHLDCRP